MEANAKNTRSLNAVHYVRLCAAALLVPIVSVIWLSVSLDVVIAHFGGNPDGPALVVLGAFLIMVGFVAPSGFMLVVGLPYALGMMTAGRLNLRTVLVPALPTAIVYGLIVYSSLQPERNPAPAAAMALSAAAGFLVASLCFYIVGVWRNVAGRSTRRAL